jgi:hypothetical protein
MPGRSNVRSIGILFAVCFAVKAGAGGLLDTRLDGGYGHAPDPEAHLFW